VSKNIVVKPEEKTLLRDLDIEVRIILIWI
jgi:hypothetical protein